MIVVDAATGLVLLALGLANRQRPPGVLLVAAGLAWFLGDVAPWAVYLHRGPLIQLVLAYPFLRPRTRVAWATVAAGYLCATLPSLTASAPATLAIAAALVLSAVYGYAVASGPERRARAAALGAAAALAIGLSAGAALQIAGLAAGEVVEFLYDLLIAAMAAGLCADLRWGRWARATVTGLVVDLGQPGPLRARLARALGDPTLTVGFWVQAQRGYVDEAGRSVHIPAEPAAEFPGGRVLTFLDVGGERVGVLIHDASALADRALVAEVAGAAQLAMANIGLRENLRARTADVAASRRRLVETADAARRGLAEELRQGPGRRLEQVAGLLHGAAARKPAGIHPQDSPCEALGDMTARLDRAQAVLRDLVVGIHPPALTAGGLPAALPELVQLSPVPVSLSVPPDRFPANVETAGYFVCSEALANIASHARASHGWIRVWQQDRRLQMEIRDDGIGGARVGGGSGLRGLADRVAALGGVLSVDSPPASGTRLTVNLPLPGTGGPRQ
jgi:signal transduction histidine kinase